MNLYNYIFRRLLYVIPIVMGVSLLIFVIFNVVAGDPTAILLGKHASLKQMAELRHELGLDRSWLMQYLDILKSAFTFNFGRSWSTKQLIAPMIGTAAGVSFTLVIPAFIVTSILSISIALIAAFYRGRLVDRSLVVVSVIMMSISGLTYILLGQWLFAYKLGWFEIAGYEYGFPHFIPYIVLPGIILVILSIGYEVRFYRTVILDEMYQDYVRTARAKGLPEWMVLFKHILKNAMVSIITNLIIQLPALLLGTLLVESFFGIPGLGGITMHAINNSDFPIIKAMTIISTVFYIIFNLITDVLYTLVDPRIRLS
ncbi:MAG: peptide ABC transporter permease [Candidatus Amoebophilus sp. 36-38]|nr:MAG: peptide ABC transporter permease [Candidatus Amoebophilus sp. 36-38]